MTYLNDPGSRRFALCIVLLFTGILSLQAFQNPKNLKLSKIYRDLIFSKEALLEYEQVNIIDDISSSPYDEDSVDFVSALEEVLGIKVPYDSMGIISGVDEIYFNKVTGREVAFNELNLARFDLIGSEFKTLQFNELNIEEVMLDSVTVSNAFTIKNSVFNKYNDLENDYHRHEIYNAEFNGFYLMTQTKIEGEFWIYDSRFAEGAYIGPHFEGVFTDFYMAGTTFEPIDSSLPVLIGYESPDSLVFKTQARINLFGEVNQMYLIENEFLSEDGEQFIYVEGDYDYMAVEGNTFESQFYPATTVTKQLMFSDNKVSGNLIFSELILQGKNNNLHWRELKGFKLASAIVLASMLTDPMEGHEIEEQLVDSVFNQTSDMAIITYKGIDDNEFEEEDDFQSLISSYYRLYKVFKDNGQIDDANQVYVEMKDVQLRYFKYKSKTYGGLENIIQWRLNSLLRFYTDYGTNPSRAIRISIFVILLFSIFYFFFPSEWDTKSKKQLIVDYKLLTEKNKHGYTKPFFRLTLGFFKSLLNAMTLSLNSFVTLGFGTIPTTGLARYVCIIQGFIGWFLLSVFTASLINQVLF